MTDTNAQISVLMKQAKETLMNDEKNKNSSTEKNVKPDCHNKKETDKCIIPIKVEENNNINVNFDKIIFAALFK